MFYNFYQIMSSYLLRKLCRVNCNTLRQWDQHLSTNSHSHLHVAQGAVQQSEGVNKSRLLSGTHNIARSTQQCRISTTHPICRRGSQNSALPPDFSKQSENGLFLLDKFITIVLYIVV